MSNNEIQSEIEIGDYCQILFEECPFFKFTGKVVNIHYPNLSDNDFPHSSSKLGNTFAVYELEITLDHTGNKKKAFCLSCFLELERW